MIFSLDVRRARKGDCLLLHFGSADCARAGPDRRRPEGGLRAAPQAAADGDSREARASRHHQPLPVDLLMVSHVDDDHIQGILDFTRELREAVGAPFVRVQPLVAQQLRRRSSARIPRSSPPGVTAQFGPAALEGDCRTMPRSRASTMKIRKSPSRPEGARQHRAGIPPAAGRRSARRCRSTRSSDGKLIMASNKRARHDRRSRPSPSPVRCSRSCSSCRRSTTSG